MRLLKLIIGNLSLAALATGPAFGWGPDGHHTVGAIAEKLIVGTRAEAQVKALLGNISLEDAAVWADCAKGVDPDRDYTYESEGRYPECSIFETPQLEAEMSDFVRRNDKNRDPQSGEESCHKQYHYTDISIQHDHYSTRYVGSRNDDIVHAVEAVTHVLKGEPAPAPFNIKNNREALLLLAHYVGDLHQPLHVGAVYLSAEGKRVDPDKGAFDPKTETRGGNSLNLGGRGNMHNRWDGVPAKLKPQRLTDALIAKARAVPISKGSVYEWPAIWAGESIGAAKAAFKGVTFGQHQDGIWKASLPEGYTSASNVIKEEQIVKAGARLARILQTIWPDTTRKKEVGSYR